MWGKKELLLVFILFIALLSFFQFQTNHIIDYDGYLHIKMADIIKENGFIQDFPWITESILSKDYADTQIGFRVLLIPFTLFGLNLGAKIAAILFSALFFTVFYLILKKFQISNALLWTLLLFFASFELLYRFLLPRPMAVSMVLLFLTVYCLFEKKHIWLIPISFLYVWLYQGFVFQIALVLIYFLIEAILYKKINFKSIAYPALGILLGLFINPYFYSNIGMLYTQLFRVNLTGNLFNEEWRPWGFKDFVLNNLVFLGCFFFSVFYLIKSKKVNKKTLFFLVITTIFLVFAIKHRRMQEYLAPFSIMFCAFNLSKVNLKKILIPLVLILIVTNSIFLVKSISETTFLYRYEGCANWMQNNVPDNSLVFINGYAFNYLFFENSNLRYTHGIDGTYSYLYSAERFDEYIKLLQGKPLSRDIIKEDFKADYVFTGKIKVDKNLNDFLIKNKQNYELAYEDENCAVLSVKK